MLHPPIWQKKPAPKPGGPGFGPKSVVAEVERRTTMRRAARTRIYPPRLNLKGVFHWYFSKISNMKKTSPRLKKRTLMAIR
jgi:hypothetical protein